MAFTPISIVRNYYGKPILQNISKNNVNLRQNMKQANKKAKSGIRDQNLSLLLNNYKVARVAFDNQSESFSKFEFVFNFFLGHREGR